MDNIHSVTYAGKRIVEILFVLERTRVIADNIISLSVEAVSADRGYHEKRGDWTEKTR